MNQEERKEHYSAPEVQFVVFETENDVIVTSTEQNELPILNPKE